MTGSPSGGILAPPAAMMPTLMTIDHPHVGTPTLGRDVLTVAGSDLRIVIYTAEPGTEDAERPILNPGKCERQHSAGRPERRFVSVYAAYAR